MGNTSVFSDLTMFSMMFVFFSRVYYVEIENHYQYNKGEWREG